MEVTMVARYRMSGIGWPGNILSGNWTPRVNKPYGQTNISVMPPIVPRASKVNTGPYRGLGVRVGAGKHPDGIELCDGENLNPNRQVR